MRKGLRFGSPTLGGTLRSFMPPGRARSAAWYLTRLAEAAIVLQLSPSLAAEDFQVNTYTPDLQDWPIVAMHGEGGFVVAWDSFGSGGTDHSDTSIHARRFDSLAAPVGDQFQINTLTSGYQSHPGIAMNAAGDFVVVWDDRALSQIRGQRYVASGAPTGGEFQVSTDPVYIPPSYSGFPSVAMDGPGGFVVVWNDSVSIQAQRFASSGAALGDQFQVDTYPSAAGRRFWSDVAMASNGDFVVVWSSYGSPSSDPDYSIKARLYGKSGSPQGAEFQVNTYTTGDQTFPSVGMDDDANFVIAWQSEGSAGTDSANLSIQAQRYSIGGASIGGEFQVNTYTTGSQGAASVTMSGAGAHVVAWASAGSSGSDSDALSIQAQRYAATGVPLGGQFQVNTYVTGSQNAPSVGLDDDGELAVSWISFGSNGTDTDSGSIQLFVSRIFASAFESGSTGDWSSASP